MGGTTLKVCVYSKGEEVLEETEVTSFFALKANDITGKPIDFSIYQDKKAILIVNVASK